MCSREVTRITTQSKGLLQIRPIGDPWGDDGHRSCAWSLKDIQTGSPTPLPLEESEFRLVTQHLYLRIGFVHRSAYDYIFGDANVDRPAWISSVDQCEIVNRAVHGALWLFQYGPILHVVQEKLFPPYQLGYTFRFAIPARDVFSMDQEISCEQLDGCLDSLHLWKSTIEDSNQQSLIHIRPKEHRWYVPKTLSPLQDFWFDILELNPEFVASRMHRLWGRDDTCSTIFHLLVAWSMWKYLQLLRDSPTTDSAMDSAMFSVMSEFRL